METNSKDKAGSLGCILISIGIVLAIILYFTLGFMMYSYFKI